MKTKIAVALVMCALLAGFMGCASSGGGGGGGDASESGNYIKNCDFSKFGKDWPNLPFNWSNTWKGGDGYEPIKTEDGRFIGWAENTYNFTLYQNVTGLSSGTYVLFAEFRLNPDSVIEDLTMSVYSGKNLLKSLDVGPDLRGAERETDILFELGDIEVTGGSVRVEFAGNNILKYIGIDNVVFSKQE